MNRKSGLRVLPGLIATFLLSGVVLTAGTQAGHAAAPLQASCKLNSVGNQVKRVIYLNFDNVHFRRDKPNVPSDLELMPNLLNFVINNGTISGNHWTPLISHTATDLLTAMTGLYGDRMGVPVANSYGFFKPDGSIGFSSSFLYWTSFSNGSAAAGDGKPQMLTETGKIAPAPWVPFTRAGCDVGAFSVANIVFESIPADVDTVFGTGSPESTEAHTNATLAQADFLGIGIHCALNSPLCANSHSRPDLLPDDPGGYTGFSALYGNFHVQPVISPNGPVLDLDGNVIQDSHGNPGFPNLFNPSATQTLGYAATMLEAGVPVVYMYISDAHDRHTGAAHAFGPGEAEYVQQLASYDAAFGKFFARLAADGIDKTNTLFLIVPDENDHFVGGQPTPAGCDGVTVPCTYSQVGEINAHLNRLLLTQRNNSTTFSVHNDDAPTVYINGNPAPTDAVTRTLEKDMDALTGVNPITGNTDKLSVFLADQAEMKLLHMVTASPARTPSFTMFGNPDYFFLNNNPNTPCTQAPSCLQVLSGFAWNHGDVQSDITKSWFAMVGPGVRNLGVDNSVFSDHTDVRPTMLSLVGLKDSYTHDGRVLVEKFNPLAVPLGVQNSASFVSLAETYKQLNAPLGSLGKSSLALANSAITSNDATYATYLNAMGAITNARDSLAAGMKSLLDNAAFNNQPIDDGLAASLVGSAQSLISEVADLGQSTTSIVSAVAPNARTTVVGGTVTAFATIINSGASTARSCSIALPASTSGILVYQTTNPTTNAPTGTPDTPVDIGSGLSQSFVLSLTPLAAFSQDIALVFRCANTSSAPVVSGLNTLMVTASNTALPDMLSVVATPSADGNLVISGTSGTGLMVGAALNIGAAGTVTFTASDTPPGQPARNLPLALSICQTNASGTCINPASPGASATVDVGAGDTLFFSVFATGKGTSIPYDPANNRVFLLANAGTTPVGEASAAVKMQAGPAKVADARD